MGRNRRGVRMVEPQPAPGHHERHDRGDEPEQHGDGGRGEQVGHLGLAQPHPALQADCKEQV